MAAVFPLPGLRFTEQPLSDVIAPPFDVISREEQAALYDKSPYNVVRLELGRSEDPYAEAQETYSAWRRQGILRPDSPSFYLYEQRFRVPGSGAAAGGQELSRRGIIARVRLEEWSAGVVLPHEETHNRAKADRLQLMRTIWANVSPVFGLYEDPKGAIRQLLAARADQAPDAEGTDSHGERHRLWRLPDGELARRIQEFFQDRKLFIADGHHRYETALALREEARRQPGRYPGAESVMMVLVDFDDPGLAVLPTHRLMHDLTPRLLSELSGRLGEYFEVVAVAESASPRSLGAALEQLNRMDRPAFGLYGPLPSGLRLLALKSQWHGHSFDAHHSAAWNELDVSLFQAIVGGEILKLSEEDMASQRYFAYTSDAADAVRSVASGDSQLAFLLRATPAKAIRDISLAHEKMPQKSTYFYPKLATGMVINPLDL